MAQYIPVRSSVTYKLNAGVSPTTGRAVIRAVSIRGADPDLTADALDAVSLLVNPLFEHPVAFVEKSQTNQLED